MKVLNVSIIKPYFLRKAAKAFTNSCWLTSLTLTPMAALLVISVIKIHETIHLNTSYLVIALILQTASIQAQTSTLII